MIRPRAAQQTRQLLARLEHRAGRLHRGAMSAPCGVARRQNGVLHRFRHLWRLMQRGGGVVQINQLFHQNISNTRQAL